MARFSLYARTFHWLLLSASVGAGCTGTLGAPAGPDGEEQVGAGRGDHGGRDDDSGRDPDEAGYDPETEGGLADLPSPSTRFARLTHAQWTNTIRDLFALPDDVARGFAEALRADANQGGFLFDNQVGALSVDESLWTGYRSAASEVAAHVTGDAARLAKLIGDERDRAKLVQALGLRVYRRPLSDAEVREHVALMEVGETAYENVEPFTGAVRLLLETMLQSPLFLYRVETSAEVSGSVIPLDAYEVASRLSYFLWNTLPDDELFEAAQTGELTKASEVARQATRMLDDPRALQVIKRFHDQVFETNKLASIAPSEAFFPDVPATLGASAAREQELFVERVIFAGELGLRELLTSTTTYVNADLAQVYGLSGDFGPEHVPVSLDPSKRSGILTQVGFLASHATRVDPDPIHRGVFIARRIACLPLPAPPDNVPPVPAIEGSTNRERVVAHTEQPGSVCAGCHKSTINPFGFAFESYDAIGAFRTHDGDRPVDTASAPLIEGVPTPVTDALELTSLLAESEAVHACYVRHWLEFAHGRPESQNDQRQIERLGKASLQGELSLRKLLVSLTASEAFLTRSAEELP